MPYYVAFDVAHKPRGKIDENYTELRDYLNSIDLICYNFLETPITQESLAPYDILVFACPDFAKISHQEMIEIENWVRIDGGGLLLLSHAGGDRGRNSNLSELSERFGITFENDQVLDETNNIGMENMPNVYIFNPPHPVTDGIGALCYRAGCSLGIIGNAYAIAVSNDTSDPFSCPLICVSDADNGRVCAIGSYEMFRNRIGGGFQHDEHQLMVTNLFNWLVSDYRTELRSGTKVSAPNASASADQNGRTAVYTDSSAPAGERSVDIDFSIKISSKSELLELLKIFQNQITTIQGTIDKLIEKAEASEDEILELKNIQAAPAIVEQQAPTRLVARNSEAKDLYELTPAPLSALPPKPADLLSKPNKAGPLVDEDFIGLPSVNKPEPDEPTGEPQEEPTEEPPEEIKETPKKKEKKSPKIDKDELEAEKEGLESKLNSIQNLVGFIEKKHESGKMDDKSYDKQIKRAKSDIEKSNKRLKEIINLLEEV